MAIIYPSLSLANLKANKVEGKKVRILIDIQNYSRGKYSKDILINPEEFQSVAWTNLNHILVQLYEAYKLLKYIYNAEVEEVILYSDFERNILNEYFIPTWKEYRRKRLSRLQDEQPLYYSSVQLFEKVNAAIFKIFEKIAEFTKFSTVQISYIDSDFFPALYRWLNWKNFNDTVFFLVAKDKDYFHLVNDNTFLFLDSFFDLDILIDYIKVKYTMKTQEAKCLILYFPLMHSLSGDEVDGFKSIVKRKGIKYWTKKFMPFYREVKKLDSLNNPKWEVYYGIIRGDFNLEELSDSNYEEFLKRLFILDFDIFSLVFIKKVMPNMYSQIELNDYIKRVISFFEERFVDYRVFNLLNMNSGVLKSNFNAVKQKEKVKMAEFVESLYNNFPSVYYAIEREDLKNFLS